MIKEGNPIELKCHFCNSGYTFTPEELKELYRQIFIPIAENLEGSGGLL